MANPGTNGGPPGDLYIEIRVKQHDIFERDGDDLHCTVPVGLTTAALGGTIEVPTLGSKAEIELPEGTQHGKTFRLRGKGIKGLRSSYPGDLYCHVAVETPGQAHRAPAQAAEGTGRILPQVGRPALAQRQELDRPCEGPVQVARNVTAAHLRDAGVGQVQTAGRVKEARLMLEREHFDIVLCTQEFDGNAPTPGRTCWTSCGAKTCCPTARCFLMVAERATYHQVVEAAESALDGLLVRPYTAALLCQRLLEARNRKRQLGDVLRALDAGQTEVAFARALKRFNDNLPYGSYCGRLAAELLLTLQRPDDARQGLRKTRPDHRRRLGSPGCGPCPDGRGRPQQAPGTPSRRCWPISPIRPTRTT
jgi:hypothetical protein